MSLTPSPQHLGRSWTGHALEDACPCPQAACGLVPTDTIDTSCDQHALTAARTMRQVHDATACKHRHVVTVTINPADPDNSDEHPTVDQVVFTCTAPEDANCRTYPTCDCETWRWSDDRMFDEAGHRRVPGQPCWVTDWFENDGAVYAGDDFDDLRRDDCVPAVARSGPISMTFDGDGVEWTWSEVEVPRG